MIGEPPHGMPLPSPPFSPDSKRNGVTQQGLIEEVAEVVIKRTEARAASFAQDFESKGLRTLEEVQQKQCEFVSEMKDKLELYAKSCDDLAHQNATLMSTLEAAVHQIQMLQWAAPAPIGAPSWASKGLGKATPAAFHGTRNGMCKGAFFGRSSHVGVASKLPTMPEELDTDLAEEEAPAISEEPQAEDAEDALRLRVAALLSQSRLGGYAQDDVPTTPPRQLGASGSGSADGCDGTIGGTPSTTAPGSPESPINLTLRRINGQPLGLEVRPDSDSSCLHVERIQPGTVAESWNRLCIGEPRAILRGDRVVCVNGATNVDDMFKEFTQKLLVKIELVRDTTA